MKGEAAHEEGEALDDRISARLRNIEEEMGKDTNNKIIKTNLSVGKSE